MSQIFLNEIKSLFKGKGDLYSVTGSTWDYLREYSCNLILGCFYIYFLYNQLYHRENFYRLDILIMIAKITLEMAFFFSRRIPKNFFISGYSWLITLFAVESVFLMTPTEKSSFYLLGLVIMNCGFLLHITTLGFLGRSFGIIPANRKIKTSGVYCLVRHPLYLSILITITGYLIANPSIQNLIVYFIGIAFHILRIYEEERLLNVDLEYQNYSTKVKWRVIPFLF